MVGKMKKYRQTSVLSGLIGLAMAVFAAGYMAVSAAASELHADVVNKVPVSYTPQLVSSTAVPKPYIDAIAQLNTTIYAGGLFTLVDPSNGNPSVTRGNFVAFDASSGVLKSVQSPGYTDPVFDGQIRAVKTFGNSVYIGGDFTTVNDISRPRLVKINANTGAIDLSFNPKIKGGTVWDLAIWNGTDGSSPVLLVAGSMGKKLISLNLSTGVNTNYFDMALADPLPGAWGGVAVYRIAINPAGNRLIATGNFQTARGQSRTRFFMADLSGPTAQLAAWYYPGFAKPCASTHPRRIAYLQGVDFSPDGTYFVITATGQIPASHDDIWPAGRARYHTVCDAAARFNMNDSERPAWINYTGGDSVWAAAATGAAVYVQGHFQWLDNPNGFASQDGGGAARREGVGAIHPVTGKALAWDPYKGAQIGGKAFLVTPAGLWTGSDSLRFDTQLRRGIAFTPLSAVMIGAGDIAQCGNPKSAATAAVVAANNGVVFTLGNNAYQSGSTVEYNNCYNPTWGAHKARTRPSPGDRDYLTPNAQGYFNYFGAAAGASDKGYYSYDVGSWHVVVLNSMCEQVGGCTATSPMLNWLRADLAAHSNRCTLAYFHHPLFSSGVAGGNPKMQPTWTELYNARVDVVVNAHDRFYERFARMRPNGAVNNARGIRQFIVGTGGTALSNFGTVHPRSEVRNNATHGVLKLTLNAASYDWQFLAEQGPFIDSGSTACN